MDITVAFSTASNEKVITPKLRNQSASVELYCRKTGQAVMGMAIESAPVANQRTTATLS
jgi:hypothetical protein